ncbi:polysaccharide biosynthesis/export family protein [Massilia sp. 9096]|uniref:polysaccharide biosynthesis/export family protein n=1 Tax=Massilia sp. 9096 TaxID=1500894 RepID=UPI0005691C20|nr:polysaccharide biosynthesis/export family protein [Massilia sp. 9096]
MNVSTTRFPKSAAGALALLALVLVLAGCAPAIHFRDQDKAGADQPAPPTELINDKLIAAERQEHKDQSNQDLDKLLVPNPPPYTIGSGDVLSIVVWDHPELAGGMAASPTADLASTAMNANAGANAGAPGFVVDHLGRIQFPLAGLLPVEGLTEEQARTQLSTKLAKYLANPNVTLRVQAYRSKRVYLDGEVKSPGLQAINDIPMTLVEAINRAGGLLPTADQSRILLERGQQRYRVNLRELVLKNINPGLVMLSPGDVVRIPSRDETKVFVSGEVITPKALTMHDGRLTLNEALGESGGISPLSGDARQVYVVRKTAERTRVFQLDARVAGSLAMAEAFELQPKDIVYVAATPLANWNRNLSLLIPGALSSAVSATNRP